MQPNTPFNSSLLNKYIAVVSLFGLVLLMLFQNCASDFNPSAYDTSIETAPVDKDSNFILVDKPLVFTATDDNDRKLLNYEFTDTDPTMGEVFSHSAIQTDTRSRNIVSSAVVTVDTSKANYISGQFRSVGTPVSNYYFGVASFDANKNPIYDKHVLRKGSVATIANVAGLNINTVETLSGWSASTEHENLRLVAFYYNGDTTKIPDYVTTNATGFSSATNKQIVLRAELPAEVLALITPQTKVMNHYHGGTYTYTNWHGSQALTNQWQSLGGVLTGEAWGDEPGKFRMGTKFIKIIFLPNYNQTPDNGTGGAKVLFNNLRIQD